MSTDARKPDTVADPESTLPAARQEGEASPGAPDDTMEASPTGLATADTWADAADQTGTVKATRRMPEPDSLGG